MANVYLAHDIILDRKVAIKVLRGDLSNDEKFIRRFQREALAASSLSHKNIVEMYDVGEDNENHFIVMEYIEGKTLKQLVKKREKLTVSEAVDIMLQVTDGMAHAHDSYIIHRDLKPQNIMIQEDGAIKITDFGIAMALNSAQLTQTNSVMGSVHYLPPEQASGKASTIKCDIYSMGILFYELLTGSLPFKGESAVEIALKHMRDPLPSIKEAVPSIPQSVENIVLRATAKNPKNRYNDVREMNEDLKVCLNEDVINQTKYTYKYPEHEPDEKNVVVKVPDEESETGEIVKKIEESDTKKTNIFIWILSIVFLLTAGVIATIIFIIPTFKTTPTILIPDVSGMSVVEAEAVLTQKGFSVNSETEKIASEDFEEGLVVKTDPIAGRSRREGTEITLYESIGTATYEIENYVGKNYIEIQTTLEKVHGLKVTIEKKTVEKTEDIDPQKIIEQDLIPGTKVIKGAKITLYIPDVYEEYPDFVGEGWSVSDIQTFCDKYQITLQIEYFDSSDYAEGTVTYQSRTGKIVNGVTLKVKVTRIPVPDPLTPGGEEEQNP